MTFWWGHHSWGFFAEAIVWSSAKGEQRRPWIGPLYSFRFYGITRGQCFFGYLKAEQTEMKVQVP